VELYQNFAMHYDSIFPVSGKTVDFLHQHFETGVLLDLGCATGGYVAELTSLGYATKGLDLDPTMIEVAKNKHPDIASHFYVSNLVDFDTTIHYHGMFCIGNTLVHLPNESSMLKFFQRVYHALEDHGTFILQIVNYDRILSKKIEALPTIELNGRRFERSYRHENKKIVFQTVLSYQEERYEAETILLPLQSNHLLRLLQQAGFSYLECYGGFDGAIFQPFSSFALVVVASKELSK
jgi:SAM-dependent methyltransferase